MIPAAAPSTQIAVQALHQSLGVPVSTRMPSSPGERFVIVSRIGGGSGPFGSVTPRFLVECYTQDALEAEAFGEIVRRAWLDLRTHGINYSYDDSNLGPHEAVDPTLNRYQFTGTLQIILGVSK